MPRRRDVRSHRFGSLVLATAAGLGAAAGPEARAQGLCAPPIAPVDTTTATVVGTGSPGSCTEVALDAALISNNGAIRFDCGPSPHTITVTSEKIVMDTLVIDGGGTVTLSGGGTTRILSLVPPFGETRTLTLQHIDFTAGYTGDQAQNSTDSGGAAVFRDWGGELRIIDCTFTANTGPAAGQDVAGGAVYSFGPGATIVVDSVFTGNQCSSGGALGNLGNDLTVVNSVISGNAATGTGGNPGNGGNGGGIYMDGNDQTVTICGTEITDNDAGARGGGIFRVSNNGIGPMTIDRSTISGNEIPLGGAASQAGGLYLQGLQLTITSSTISGNTAASTGGAFIWEDNENTQTLQMTNVTVAENHASTGLGAGLTINANVTGSLHHVTIARNSNEGEFSFASAISGGSGVTLTNSLIADNTKVFIYENTSCNVTHAGGGNVQWPPQNAAGGGELACASGVSFADPGLGALEDNGGGTPTILPSTPGVLALASGCPATDQRGRPRGEPCAPGAVEPSSLGFFRAEAR